MRLFVAVELPPDVKDALYRDAMYLRGEGVRASYPSRDAYHITLKFLGEVPDGDVEGVCRALSSVSGVPPFEVRVEGRGVFPGFSSPRVVWCGVAEGASSLSALSSAVEEALEPLGFERETRPFVPHITLCRVKRVGMREKRLIRDFCREAASYGAFWVRRFALFRSILRPEGALYRVIKSFPLEGGE